MNLLLVIPSVLLLSDTVYTQNCALTASPPDSKSGCCGHSVMDGVTTSGTNARIDEYPWMGLVEYQKKGEIKLLCSAVLISGRYALSAGSCFSDVVFKVGTPVNVRLGEYDVNNDGPDCVDTAGQKACNNGALTIPIEKFTLHPEYKKRNRQNDITLIRLEKMVNYNDFIRPICLPSLDVTLKAPMNLYMTVAGWGAVNHTSVKSNVLRRVHVPYVDFYVSLSRRLKQDGKQGTKDPEGSATTYGKPVKLTPEGRNMVILTKAEDESYAIVKLYLDKLCRHKYNETKDVTLSSGQLCAGSKNRDACKGDSGGPLMLIKGSTTELAGIVSFGPQPCGQDIPGVYTKVYAYNDWIRMTIAADELIATSTVSPTNTPTTAKPVQPLSVSNDFYSDFIVFKE